MVHHQLCPVSAIGPCEHQVANWVCVRALHESSKSYSVHHIIATLLSSTKLRTRGQFTHDGRLTGASPAVDRNSCRKCQFIRSYLHVDRPIGMEEAEVQQAAARAVQESGCNEFCYSCWQAIQPPRKIAGPLRPVFPCHNKGKQPGRIRSAFLREINAGPMRHRKRAARTSLLRSNAKAE